MNYVIYNRVSTEEQSENGVNLQAMESACRAFIQAKVVNLSRCQIRCDLNRPHLQELLQDIITNAIPMDIIPVWRSDRLIFDFKSR